MYLHSRRRIRMRGVVADTIVGNFWMPDASARKVNAVVLGATNFGRVGKREVLNWPPQTIFAEFNQEFLRSELSMGYAKPLVLNGFLVKAHRLHDPREQRFAFELQRQQRKAIGHNLEHWLAREHHPQYPHWSNTAQTLGEAITAYVEMKLTLPQILQRFVKVFSTMGVRQQQRVDLMVKNAWSMVAKFDRTLDERLPPVWLLINVQQVTVFQYGDNRDAQITSEPNDFERRDEAGYLQHMFNQVQLQKAEFKRLDLPFYDPDWLARQRRLNEPVWEPSSLKAYHLYEEDSDAR